MGTNFKVLFKEVQSFYPTLNFTQIPPPLPSFTGFMQNSEVGKSKIIDERCIVYRDADGPMECDFDKKLEPFEAKFLDILFEELFKCYVGNKHDKPEDFARFAPGYILNAICRFTNKKTRFKDQKTQGTRTVEYFIHPNTMVNLVDGLISWIGSRNEGKQPNFSFTVFDNTELIDGEANIDYLKVVTEKYFERLSVAESTSIIIDKFGNIIEHISTDLNDKQLGLDVPVQTCDIISTIAKCARKKGKSFVTVMLLQGRDVLLIRDGDLLFAKRGARWKVFNEKIVSDNLKWKDKALSSKLTSTVYQSLIDASFSYSGAGLAILDVSKEDMDENYLRNFQEYIDGEYIIDSDIFNKVDQLSKGSLSQSIKDEPNKSKRRQSIRRVMGYGPNISNVKIINSSDGSGYVDRHLLKELMSIDGSTIIDNKGTIIAVGALVRKYTQIAEGGARLAAAVAISEIGLGIKISEDGEISGYRGGKPAEGGKLTPVFKMG